jgi:hypothetical protein
MRSKLSMRWARSRCLSAPGSTDMAEAGGVGSKCMDSEADSSSPWSCLSAPPTAKRSISPSTARRSSLMAVCAVVTAVQRSGVQEALLRKTVPVTTGADLVLRMPKSRCSLTPLMVARAEACSLWSALRGEASSIQPLLLNSEARESAWEMRSVATFSVGTAGKGPRGAPAWHSQACDLPNFTEHSKKGSSRPPLDRLLPGSAQRTTVVRPPLRRP